MEHLYEHVPKSAVTGHDLTSGSERIVPIRKPDIKIRYSERNTSANRHCNFRR